MRAARSSDSKGLRLSPRRSRLQLLPREPGCRSKFRRSKRRCSPRPGIAWPLAGCSVPAPFPWLGEEIEPFRIKASFMFPIMSSVDLTGVQGSAYTPVRIFLTSSTARPDCHYGLQTRKWGGEADSEVIEI